MTWPVRLLWLAALLLYLLALSWVPVGEEDDLWQGLGRPSWAAGGDTAG